MKTEAIQKTKYLKTVKYIWIRIIRCTLFIFVRGQTKTTSKAHHLSCP